MSFMKQARGVSLLRGVARSAVLRHLMIAGVGIVLLGGFAYVHVQWSPMHRWNRVFGDVSLVLVALSVSIGPLSRLVRPASRILPFRRELGIHACLYAVIHTAIILVGWVEYDLMRLFGFEWHPDLLTYVMFQQGFALANAIGVAALVLAILLAVTSSDFAMQRLGVSGWKFLQMGVLPLWWLMVAHVGYFLFVHFLSFHREIPEANPLQPWFVALVLVVLILRGVAYVLTVRGRTQGIAGNDRSEHAPL